MVMAPPPSEVTALPIGWHILAPPLRSFLNERRVGGKNAEPPRMRSRLRVTFPRSAHAQSRVLVGEARAARAGALRAAGVRGKRGGGGGAAGDERGSSGDSAASAAMYRHVTAAVTARLRPGRAWAPAASAAPGAAPPRRRYRARPQVRTALRGTGRGAGLCK